jgi:hypothetical protein
MLPAAGNFDPAEEAMRGKSCSASVGIYFRKEEEADEKRMLVHVDDFMMRDARIMLLFYRLLFESRH